MKLNYNKKKELTRITLLPLHDKGISSDSGVDDLSILGMDYSTGDDDNNSEITATITDEDKAEVPERTLPDKITVTPEFLRKVLSDIMFETEAYFGRPLSMPESESLIYIYDQLGFSQELIEYLIEYCLTMGKASFRYAETVAIAWYEKGIDTVDKAKADSSAYNPFYRKVFSALGIRRSNPTSIETAYIDAWTGEMNFSEDLILLACEKAIISKPQSANFAYVNGILENWHKNGVQSIRDVELLDQEFLKKKSAATAQPAATRNPNGFANFKQTDMSNQLDKLEQMLADELNLDKR